MGTDAFIDIIETENNRKIDILESKVLELRKMSRQIQTEVRETNSILGDMTNEMNVITNKVQATVKRMIYMGSYKSARSIWAVLFIACVLLIALYVFVYLKSFFKFLF